MRIDLNCDMGESFSVYTLGLDHEVIKYITSANIACGWHAGDPMVMDMTVRMAVENGVGVGAHPSYPDLLGFGRRNMDCLPEEITNYIIYQIGALYGFCRVHGASLRHVKAHGNLYNTAAEHEIIARAIAQAVADYDPSLLLVALAGPKGETVAAVGQQLGLSVMREAFADRAYTPQGALVSRREPDAVIKDPKAVAERVVMMVRDGIVIAADGSRLRLRADTVCVHGDTPGAVDLIKETRSRLETEGIEVKPMGSSA
jgi:UPF0271 protein